MNEQNAMRRVLIRGALAAAVPYYAVRLIANVTRLGLGSVVRDLRWRWSLLVPTFRHHWQLGIGFPLGRDGWRVSK